MVWSALFPAGLFTYPFMAHAWAAGLAIAAMCGLTGYFIVVRGAAFMAHAIPQSAFAGAAFALFANWPSVAGIGTATALAAAGIAWLGGAGRAAATIAMVLVLSLGLGDLFLTLGNAYGPAAYALLFGQVVGISASQAWLSAILAAALAVAVLVSWRPLLFATLFPATAQARGLSPRWMDLWFAVLVAAAATVTVPVAGALLTFSLLVGPAASAAHLASEPLKVMGLAALLAALIVALSLVIAYDTSLPVGLMVTGLSAILYAVARTAGRHRRRLPSVA